MSIYRETITQTTQVIDRRAKTFRNLIVAVSVTGLASFFGAIWASSWLPLTGLFLIVPICGTYFYLDSRLVNRWRNEILKKWTIREIDIHAFKAAIAPLSSLPQQTIQSMMKTLPAADDLVSEQAISSPTRGAIAATVTVFHACSADQIAFKTAGFTAATLFLASALFRGQWEPLLFGLIPIFLVLISSRLSKKRRLRKAGEIKEQHATALDFDPKKVAEVLGKFRWYSNAPVSSPELSGWQEK